RALRPTEQRRTRIGAALRKRTRTANPWLGFLLDGIDANVGYTSSDGSTVTTEQESKAFDAGIGWVREPRALEVGVVPGFAEGAVRALLPGFLEDGIADARLRLTPVRVSIGTSYFRQDSRIFRFERIIRHPSDSAAVPTVVPREAVQTVADVRLRPFRPLTADLAMLTSRDLLGLEEVVSDPRVRDLIRGERSTPAGVDVGWETNRTLRTNLAYRPALFTWLRNDVDWTTVYQSERNANFLERSGSGSDTTLALARNARADRDWGATVALDPGRLAIAWLGGPRDGEGAGASRARAVMSALRPVSVTYRDGITSRFNRDPIDPGLGYQLGWGGTESFRILDADTAATLTDRYSWRVGSGLSLPGGASLQVDYQWTDAKTLDTRSDRRTVLRSWPEMRASLPTLVPPSSLGIRAINISSGVVRTQRTMEFGGRAAQRRFDEDIRIPVDVSVQWQRTLVTSYQGAFRVGQGEDPTGETERDEWAHRVSVTSQLLPAGFLSRRFDRPVSLSVLGAYTSERTCRATTARDECVAFVDLIRRTLNVSLDTSVRGFSVGLQMSFDDRQSFVGQRTGSTQFQVGLFGQLDFSGGTLPFR
ncbi:MAG TPA: hypothetical protein VLA09_06510, partial [Longimicrobiales bacterium]|nr:hypothetical protein [Longimicrobiales bacterium]